MMEFLDRQEGFTAQSLQARLPKQGVKNVQ
jgi:hypothetical protein